MYRTYSINSKCAHFMNGKILHKKAIFEKAEIKEEYHPRSELTTQSSFDDETIHFSHDDKRPILPK